MEDFLEKTLEQLEEMQIGFDEIDRDCVVDYDITSIMEMIESLREEITSLQMEE